MAFRLSLALLSWSAAAVVAERRVTPIQKVLELLDGMEAKGVAEKEAEEVGFSKFSSWCANQQRVKKNEIQAATDLIAKQQATIEKSAVHIEELTKEVHDLDNDIGGWEEDIKSATEVRSKENAQFQTALMDLDESITAIGGAVKTMKGAAAASASASLLQITTLKLVPAAAKKALLAFLQQEPSEDEMMAVKAPEAAAFESSSGGIVDILDKLLGKFEKQRTELPMKELQAKHAHEQVLQQLTDDIENAKHQAEKKEKRRGAAGKTKADTEGEQAKTRGERDEDGKYLEDTVALCKQKSQDFENRQRLRAEELEALRKAKDIISSGAVSGAGEKHLPSLLQKPAALAQLRTVSTEPLQGRVAAFLADRAQICNSKLLLLASQRVAEDPFGKVKKMIKDLVSKLTDEAGKEAEHKGWCDAEMGTNKVTRDSKAEEVSELNAQIEGLTSTIAQITQDTADLAAALKELESAMAEATEERDAAKAKNEQTIEEAKEAQTAVEQAIAVLKDFYAKSAEATALAQQKQEGPAEDAPDTFDKPYTGMGSEGGGVVGMLEVILTDFTRLESETEAAEAGQATEYKTYMLESERDQALKQNAKGHMEDQRVDKESELRSAQEELAATQDQLSKAIAYFEKLKPTCVDSGVSYEERVQRREEEMQSLQEAMNILTGTDIA